MINPRITLNRNGHLTVAGERTIEISLCENGERVVINTGLRVKEEDFKNGIVLPSCPFHQSYNTILIETVKKLYQIYSEMIANNQYVTPSILREAYRNNLISTVSLKEWIDCVVGKSDRKESTKQGYSVLYKNIVEHSGKRDIKIKEINYYYVNDFIVWLAKNKKMQQRTIISREKLLSCLLHEAANNKIIKAEDNPFNKIKIPEMKPVIEYLDWEDLKNLAEVELDDGILEKVRDAFLFCCYTGLRFSDFKFLKSKNIDKNHIMTVDQLKTGHLVRIPLKELFMGKPLEILAKYGTIEQLINVGCNSNCNRKIQIIGQKAKVSKRLHWHLARHTCGTLLNKVGMKMHEIQAILGHQRLSTTSRHYAHTMVDQVQESLERQFKLFNKKMNF